MKKDPTAIDATEAQEVARQAKVELAILLGLEQSLRHAIQWMTRDRGNTRKLSTLRFAMGSLERHLARMQVLADHGGYLQSVTDANPHLANDVKTLRDVRAELRARFDRITLRLEYVSPNDSAEFGKACTDLESYLEQLNTHGQNEIALLQHSFVQEEGGEG